MQHWTEQEMQHLYPFFIPKLDTHKKTLTTVLTRKAESPSVDVYPLNVAQTLSPSGLSSPFPLPRHHFSLKASEVVWTVFLIGCHSSLPVTEGCH